MMARFYEPTKEEQDQWQEWLEERPESIRKLAERFDPWSLYLLKPTGQRVSLYSFSEDGSLTVEVSGRFNQVWFERTVFGIDPNDLEPCGLPDPQEILGAMLSPEQVEGSIDFLRAITRPDLFVMGEDGKAKQKG